VIIFLNESRFLNAAIESVLAQTCPDWELLLVDDGSTDGSTEIACNRAQQWPGRVRYLEHPGHVNRGMSASRNLGLARGRGDYVAFLDADDVWLPRKLEEQLTIMRKHRDVGLVYGRTMLWRSWQAGEMSADEFLDLGVRENAVTAPPQLVFRLLENRCQTPTTCNALMRRSAVLAVGGFEDAFGGMFEDQAFFLKLCLQERAYVSTECWAWYRQRSDSFSARVEAAGHADRERLRLLDWFGEYLQSRGVPSGELAVAMRRARRDVRWGRLSRWMGHLDWMRHRCTRALRHARGTPP
jgi:glycosyltransferase involved in cell wall biosynthesis